MSDVNKVDLLEKMKQQHADFCEQRDKSSINLQQLIGAIYACEMMIKIHEDALVNDTVED